MFLTPAIKEGDNVGFLCGAEGLIFLSKSTPESGLETSSLSIEVDSVWIINNLIGENVYCALSRKKSSSFLMFLFTWIIKLLQVVPCLTCVLLMHLTKLTIPWGQPHAWIYIYIMDKLATVVDNSLHANELSACFEVTWSCWEVLTFSIKGQ